MRILVVTPAFNPPHGGLRIICEWASRLTSFGHRVSVHSLAGDTPGSWCPLPGNVKLQSAYDTKGVELLLITSPHGIHLTERPDCPEKVFLFMQMLEDLFRPNDTRWAEKCRQFYTSPHPLICISRWNERELRSKWKRGGPIYYVGNGVNLEDFPIEPDCQKDPKLVLVEGWEPGKNPTKDAEGVARQVARQLKSEGYTIAAYSQIPLSHDAEVPDEYYLRPSLTTLNNLYRRAAILLKASKYDARACAPVEAMTKGTPTARAIIEGDDDLDASNSIRCGYSGPELYSAAKHLLTDPHQPRALGEKCLQHVETFSWDYWMPKINEILTGQVKAFAKTVVVAVVYQERQWQETKRDIERLGVPVVYVDRSPKGTGSLAEAINRGYREAKKLYDFEYVWFVTNIRFGPSAIPQLESALDANPNFAAMHPAFDSDHAFCRKGAGTGIGSVPFVEFTAPLVRRSAFESIGSLDENMPFWGHDLDWGVRARNAGHFIGVDYSCTVEHVYIRNNKSAEVVTKNRAAARKRTDKPTENALIAKWGGDWKKVTGR